MKVMFRRYWTRALAGMLLVCSTQQAFADQQQNRSTDRQRFNQLMALRSRSSQAVANAARPMASNSNGGPYSKSGVDAFNRRVVRQGRIPPPIPTSLLITPRPPAVEQVKRFRADYILSLYRFRGLRHGGYAGGLFFTPPAGTPYFPVDPINIFNYFPVYRVP